MLPNGIWWLGIIVPVILCVLYVRSSKGPNVPLALWANGDALEYAVTEVKHTLRHATATLLTLSMVAVTAGLLVGPVSYTHLTLPTICSV